MIGVVGTDGDAGGGAAHDARLAHGRTIVALAVVVIKTCSFSRQGLRGRLIDAPGRPRAVVRPGRTDVGRRLRPAWIVLQVTLRILVPAPGGDRSGTPTTAPSSAAGRFVGADATLRGMLTSRRRIPSAWPRRPTHAPGRGPPAVARAGRVALISAVVGRDSLDRAMGRGGKVGGARLRDRAQAGRRGRRAAPALESDIAFAASAAGDPRARDHRAHGRASTR